jgi:hypothetical protein
VIALIVGTVLLAPPTYLVPFVVATWGALVNSRVK